MASGGEEDPGEGPSVRPDGEDWDNCDVETKMHTIRKMMPSNVCEPRALTLDPRRAESMKLSRKDKFRSLYWKNSLRRKRQAARTESIGGGGDVVDSASTAQIYADNPEHYILEYLKDGGNEDEQAMLEELRKFPEPLTLRRKVKRTLSKQAEVAQRRRKKSISVFSQMTFAMSLATRRFWLAVKESLRDWQLWNTSLKRIEGSFGSGVGSYFRFLRSLFLMDAFIGAILLFFIVVPRWLGTSNPDSVEEPVFNESSLAFKNKLSMFHEFRAGVGQTPFKFWDIFTGEGYLQESFLFYGAYKNQAIVLYPGTRYAIPHAYFFTTVAAMLLAIVIISQAAASSFRQNFIARNGSRLAVVSLVFCGWDFNIMSKSAAKSRHKFITTDLEEFVDVLTHTREKWTSKRVLVILALNLAVLASIGGIVVAFLLLLDASIIFGGNADDASDDSSGDPSGGVQKQAPESSVHMYIVPLLASTVMFVVPMVFSYLAVKEGYSSPRTQLYVTLLRSFVLQCAVLASIAYYCVTRNDVACWESTFGSMMYRLVIMDFIFYVLLGSVMDWLKRQVVKHIARIRERGPEKKLLTYPVFDVARNTMNLIYNQSLVWLGLYFCPSLPLIAALRYLVTFFLNEFDLLHLCDKKRQKTWRAAQTNSVFLAFAFFACLISMAFLFYGMSEFDVSSSCGPFYVFNTTSELFVSVMDDWDASSEFLLSLIAFLQGSWPKALAVMFLLAFIYHMRETSEAHRQVGERLMEQLQELRSDKSYYLKQIENEYRQRSGSMKAATRDQLNNLGRLSFIRMTSADDSRLSASNSRTNLLASVVDDDEGCGSGEFIPLREMDSTLLSTQDVTIDVPKDDDLPASVNTQVDPNSHGNRNPALTPVRSESMVAMAGSFHNIDEDMSDDQPAVIPSRTSLGPSRTEPLVVPAVRGSALLQRTQQNLHTTEPGGRQIPIGPTRPQVPPMAQAGRGSALLRRTQGGPEFQQPHMHGQVPGLVNMRQPAMAPRGQSQMIRGGPGSALLHRTATRYQQ